MYRRFISFFRYRDATRALRGSSGILGPKLWTLDAGAGSELQRSHFGCAPSPRERT